MRGKENSSTEPEIVIFFVNGMLTGPREASLDALELGEFLGMKVRTIYNPTHGIICDFIKDIWLFLGGKSPITVTACKEIGDVLETAPVTVVTIAHSQGAMVINKAINLLKEVLRARLGVVALASPIVIKSAMGILFVEHLAASHDPIAKLSQLQGGAPEDAAIVVLESDNAKRFEHSFLGGTYQKSGWPRLKEIIEKLKIPKDLSDEEPK